MLDLSTAVLCDFAQVRDRLLFVSSGAVSRLYRQELPSPLGLMVGLVIEVPLEDAGMEHSLRAEVINRHGTVLATLDNTFRVSDAGLFPHEVQQVPLVLSITGVRARTWGTHQVRLYLDDDLVRALTLYVVPAAAPQGAVRPAESRGADEEGGPLTPVPSSAPTERAFGGEPDTEQAAVEEDAAPAEDPTDDDFAAPSAAEPVVQSQPEPQPEPQPQPQPQLEPEPAPQPQPQPQPEPMPQPEPEPVRDAVLEPEMAEAPPEFDLHLDPELDLQVSPSPAWRSPRIDAPPAKDEEPAPVGRPLFDFDEDDLDADPAERPTEAGGEREPSRFSFRYRYEDDEEE
jgi:outer membrane biosynthesis protein TonB